MKIAFLSDTHGKHWKVEFPTDFQADFMVFAGDATMNGNLPSLEGFCQWARANSWRFPRGMAFVAGNHDFCFEDERKMKAVSLVESYGFEYLEDSSIVRDDVKIWGSPITPWFHAWAFNRKRGSDIDSHWEKIEADSTVLVTHGPPLGILDETINGDVVGCADLHRRIYVDRQCPKLQVHAFGHIHEEHGSKKINDVTAVNVSIVDVMYQVAHSPTLIETE